MPRVLLTEEQKRERKRAAFAKVVAGKPNPSGRRGSPEVWASIADELMNEYFPGVVFTSPATASRENKLLALLNLTALPSSLEELKTARNKALMTAHPDKGGTAEATREVLRAYGELATFFPA